METFTSRNKKSKQDNKESYNKTDSTVDSKLKQLKISREKTGFDKTDEVKPEIKVISSVGNHRLLKFGSVTLPSSETKTPKPPKVPRSTAFWRKDTASRLGGDGEACEEGTEDIDYCCIERLPGDGCFSECTELTEDDDVGQNFSDGYYEDDLLEEGIDDINDESCSEGIIFYSLMSQTCHVTNYL
jgi:hypothetical protein